MKWLLAPVLLAALAAMPPVAFAQEKAARVLNVNPPPIAADKSVKYDYDIVYVRAPRHGDLKRTKWAEFSDPTRMEPDADLMLLHPDGSEELLVSGKGGSVMDPYVSFDGEWVYFAKFIDDKHSGSDIHKIHVKSRKVVKLTDQTFTPNTGAAPWARDYRTPEKGKTALRYGVYNLGPCPAPGGKIVFTSNRNAYAPPRGYPRITLQLHVMDDDGKNVEQIGYLNIACALHPVILTDGRILYSTLESHAAHNSILWGIWSIHPDGTNWQPVVSAYWTGGAPPAFHFQTQLSDQSIIVEQYYNLNNSGFGTFLKLPLRPPEGVPAFGPAFLKDPRNAAQRYGGRQFHMPFTPYGLQVLTRFAFGEDGPAQSSVPREQVKARTHGGDSYPQAVGKVTHPCGAPDNHLLAVWTPGPANHQYNYYPLIDSGIYLIKDGQPIDEPGQMLRIKNDPRYNEQWPRPLVPYRRIYGIDAPPRLVQANDGKGSPHLPEGTPFGLVGTSSLYKRESAPDGYVPPGSVTAVPADPKRLRMNWQLQGADAGIYANSDIHAIRILAQEPRTDIKGNGGGPLYGNHALERLRILGEIPVRHFGEPGASTPGGQPHDPDGNPDTSFLARLPANQSFTFQTIDKNGMVLNMAQTWHQLRPGEIRTNCGGCHAHSQKPTVFEKTLAARPDYKLFDLTGATPLLTTTAHDQSGRQWDVNHETGLRYVKGIVNVEYFHDIRPLLDRSCVACHSHKAARPAGDLVLDDDDQGMLPAFGHDSGPSVQVPRTYFRLAVGKERYKTRELGLAHDQASRYLFRFQSRRSLLVWKLFGKRMDSHSNDDFPSLAVRNDPKSLHLGGKPVPKVDYSDDQKLRYWIRDNVQDIDYTGSIMPPPAAVAGTFRGADGKLVKVAPVTDEDRRTIIRWIDLGCPIDLDPNYDPRNPQSRSYGWHGDDQRPTLTLTYPAPGRNPPLSRILVGMCDAYSGLDLSSFGVVADFPLAGAAAGQNLAPKFRQKTAGVWELVLDRPLTDLPRGTLTVWVQDRQGNRSRIERSFSVGREQ
jgi:Hydrazine synthase alpha subunit middle domain